MSAVLFALRAAWQTAPMSRRSLRGSWRSFWSMFRVWLPAFRTRHLRAVPPCERVAVAGSVQAERLLAIARWNGYETVEAEQLHQAESIEAVRKIEAMPWPRGNSAPIVGSVKL